ncbi:ABC transporter permease [Clostridium aciditolerans]|uniref:Transport permease protein n=1 Tax=Clostridium aciditolerans TaxID=339861 RepID=A0A934M3V2_9CLOT|nr:ABC transporter permease [Clostridium aciditolerans]MBI6873582.1 ABC transporter permease [Clostridium aciditolerans]
MNKFRNYILNFLKYKNLIWKLTVKDLKVKYKRSFLGIAWSLLNPLLTMIVLTIVFQSIFRFNIANFPVYLISGQVLFNFFSESTNLAMSSIFRDGQLIKKVYIPKYIFPISKVLFSFINMSISLIAIFLVCILTGVKLTYAAILAPLGLIYIAIFSMGFGLMLCSIGVFFRDLEHIYSVILTIWSYLTPVFYPINIIPQKYIIFILYNPMYYFIDYFRQTILYGNVPTLQLNLVCLACSVIMFIIGLYIFYKSQDKFVVNI